MTEFFEHDDVKLAYDVTGPADGPPVVLLLDEPTSALDLHTEADFLDGLGELMVGRTVFIVAHRLSTIRTVDRIYFLEAGCVAEQGSHDELMSARGRYHDLYMRQFGTGAVEPAVV